jgi:hypothetical protein
MVALIMKKIIYFLCCLLFFALILSGVFFVSLRDDVLKERKIIVYQKPSRNSFEFQAIDTMKYSRDLSREKLNDQSFDKIIEEQVSNIAKTGATHIAIATPYDQEFVPFLKRWIDVSRKHKLKVWFRGNWSGWEGWFGYSQISREEHMDKTKKFILENKNLFEDGDAFSSCPECENGGTGDPRQTGDVAGYRKFLVDEYNAMKSSFEKIDKEVRIDLFSMNGDVAKLIMDKNTTKLMGGTVTIDHYVESPDKLIKDVELLAKSSGGKIVLGEFGAPIPDIHGQMDEKEQASWVAELLEGLQKSSDVQGLSYWLNVGGSTEIWKGMGEPKLAVEVISRYYNKNVVYGTVFDEFGNFLEDVTVEREGQKIVTNKEGYFELKFIRVHDDNKVKIYKPGYFEQEIDLKNETKNLEVILIKKNKSFKEKSIIYIDEFLKK